MLATPPGATQGQEDCQWVDRAVWTERMLEALRRGGPDGGRWYSLHDKVFAEKTLRAAFAQVAANGGAPGVDGMTVEAFGEALDEQISRLRTAWQTGTYRPQAVRRTWIPKAGSHEQRPLGIPTVRDRVVQTALKLVLEPIFEREFHPHSYGFRPGRSAHDALHAVVTAIQADQAVVVDVDLKAYFDRIPHGRLLSLVRQKVTDGRILELIEGFLKADVRDGAEVHHPETGTPQGGVISPLLANLYLNALDHLMAQSGWTMIRYADDFVVLCRTMADATKALAQVQRWTTEVGLTLHPTKTRVVDLTQPSTYVDFLGFRLSLTTTKTGRRRILRDIRPQSLDRIKETIRQRTPRNSGRSLRETIAELNPALRGWFGYFRSALNRIHTDLDQMIRRRLRSQLLRFHGITRFGTGRANQRWPNAHFAQHGLFSLVAAREAFLHAPRRAH
jgi:RNA-directed DNA polymerase